MQNTCACKKCCCNNGIIGDMICGLCRNGEHKVKSKIEVGSFPKDLISVNPVKLSDSKKLKLYAQQTFITIKTSGGKISGRGKSNMFIVNHWKFQKITHSIRKSKKGYIVTLK